MRPELEWRLGGFFIYLLSAWGERVHRAVPGLLKNTGDDLIQGRILHAHVDNLVGNPKSNSRPVPPCYISSTKSAGYRPLLAGHFAETSQIVVRLVAFEMQLDQFGPAELVSVIPLSALS